MQASTFLTRVERLPLGKLWSFAIRQAWAALFGGLMLGAIIATSYVDLPYLSQYDWLFLIAITIQIGMLLLRLEKPYEVIVIVLFHLVGLGMELFKTSSSIGSWQYPGDAIFRVGAVPLFSGFMYAAVGSYIARSWRVMHLRFTHRPKTWAAALLALAIYINFFSHHFTVDIRLALFAAVLALYGRVWVSYAVNGKVRRMPLVVAFLLITFFIWIAENIGTITSVWLYPTQVMYWQPVSIQKFGSWFLLMVISFIMVDTLHHIRAKQAPQK